MGLMKRFIFDGIESKDYGLGVSGVSAYNGAKRSVEMIAIPGRDGEYALDHGRFENVPVTYKCGAFSKNQPDFAQKISELRNELLSRRGYKRLEDDYNINEYRMGLYEGGLEFDPVLFSTASEFDVVFNCKPQRFLKSGDEEITLPANGRVFNPTPYPAKPLLAVKGYGSVNVNGGLITLNNDIPLGWTILADASTSTIPSDDVEIRPVLENGDTFWFTAYFYYEIRMNDTKTIDRITSEYAGLEVISITDTAAVIRLKVQHQFTYGTEATETDSITVSVVAPDNVGSTLSFSLSTDYDGEVKIITEGSSTVAGFHYSAVFNKITTPSFSAVSSKPSLGDPTYIDLDIGEAYQIIWQDVVSVNNAVSLGSILPVLRPGENLITWSNTITEVKLTPRWWIL